MTGQIVISKAGHDKGTVYAVIKETSDGIYLADGAGRKCENPKKKNPKHVIKTDAVVDGLKERMDKSPEEGNKAVRKAVADYLKSESEKR